MTDRNSARKQTSDYFAQWAKKNSHDREIIERLEKLADQRSFGEIMYAFPGFINRINMTRMLAYYELFKMIEHKPGYIVECGVYRGFSLFALARYMEIFCPGNKNRKVIGFDNFTGFTEISPQDGKKDENTGKTEGGISPSGFRDEVMELMDICNQDSFAPWGRRVLIVEGDVELTIPQYVADNPGLRISMLHLDVDLYKPSLVALKSLYQLVVPGGLIVMDEYGYKEWGGESKALEDYFSSINSPLPDLRTFTWCSAPSAYFFKPG